MSGTPTDQSTTGRSKATLSNSQKGDLLDKLKEAGLELVQAKTEPDQKDRLEAEDASRQQAKYLAELIEDLKTNRALRRDYGDRVFRYLKVYSGFCAIIILLQGWEIKGFKLNETALTVLVGSTAVAAIGLVGIVVKGLFGSQSNGKSGNSKDKKDNDDGE